MRLSISNIAWGPEDDDMMLKTIADSGFDGIEIAPTRITPQDPYLHLEKAQAFYDKVEQHGLCVPSMQSIWFGCTERIFFDAVEREALIEYTKKAMDFARVLHCENLVFGSPKNRSLEDETQRQAGYAMFSELADYAVQQNTVFAIEPNPAIYNTNFINETEQAFALAHEINHPGFKVNVDLGTIIENSEVISILVPNMDLVNHIHISEPYLAVPQKRELHQRLAALLKTNGYQRFVSIEMKNPGDIEIVKDTMTYIKEVFK